MTRDPESFPYPPAAEPDPLAPERKERVIHTRVPALLEQELKRMAGALRVPVSNVVRVILQDAVEAVDRVGRRAEGEVRGLAERLAQNRGRLRDIALGHGPLGRAPGGGAGEAERARRTNGEAAAPKRPQEARGAKAIEGILGFQPLVLATGAECAVCGRRLKVGERALLGVRATEGPRVLIGRECLPGNKKRHRRKENEP
ncbi:MAG: hypothetical protein HY744_05405 [Deltaproteobacteria bacterium]|nr:hypothetical protein [Deltaproteobacteria bacterium]